MASGARRWSDDRLRDEEHSIDLGPRYEFIRELGSGGAARVLLVRDLHLRRQLALKLLHDPPVTAEDLEQVQREYALLAEIEHPGIARAYDFGYLEDRPFFTAEFVPGEPLHRQADPWSPPRLLRLALDLSESLGFLHHRGIVHLDVKPGNVIASSSPGRRRAVLIDFGLFRRGIAVAEGPAIRGSLPYMGPECFRGGELGPWTDVYALGVLLFRIATGRFPRVREPDAVHRLDESDTWDPAPPAPSMLSRAVSQDLDGVILRCLALDPGARFAAGAEVHEALLRFERGRVTGRPGGGSAVPVVGRQEELARAGDFIAGIRERGNSPRVLLVTGLAGAGQSHFLRALKIRAQTQGLRFYLEVGYAGRQSPAGSLLRALGAHMPTGSEDRSRWNAFLDSLRQPRRGHRSDLTEGERRLRRAGEVTLAARAVSEPMVLAVDGLQYWDEVSVELLTHLVRFLGEGTPGEALPLGVIAAYREEGPSAPTLRELTRYLLQPGKATTVTLGPLSLEETRTLHRALGGGESDERGGLSVYQNSGGYPGRIAARIRPGRGRGLDSAVRPGSSPGAGTGSVSWQVTTGKPGLTEPDRDTLLLLALLERPATVGELARHLGARRDRVRRSFTRLEAAGLVARAEGDELADEDAWVAVAGLSVGDRERRGAHVRLGQSLEREAARGNEPALVEAIRHYLAAGRRQSVVTLGLRAGKYLKASFQHRAALDVFRAVLEALPPSRRAMRLEVALEIADLHSRIGDAGIEEGIRTLREVLPWSRQLARGAYERVLLRIATLHSRRGDFRRAEALFSEGLRRFRAEIEGCRPRGRAKGSRSAVSREELLHFVNEHAAMQAATGRYAEARELCRKGLRLAGRSRNPEIREVVLNLHATRANIALRGFEFEDAVRELETAVEIAEAIGSPGNHATLLNNLGAVYSQCDRYQDAIRAYLEAEQSCRRLDEGPSLASIHGNRAVLLAKTGDFRAMEAALAGGERLLPAAIGRRQEFSLEHARGLCRLAEGRYAEAQASLETAIGIGEAIGDRHVVTFDRVYRAEALIFAGRLAAARQELLQLSESGQETTRRMALARGAYLEALLGRREESLASVERHAKTTARPGAPYLDAWDGLFMGWALCISGEAGRALEVLAPVEAFFGAKGLYPAHALVRWILAERMFLEGDPSGARKMLADGHALPGHCQGNAFTAVLVPLLEARSEMDVVPLSERCGDLLATAGGALVGNPLPEWSFRLEALRARLRGASDRDLGEVEKSRRELCRELPPKIRRSFLQSPYWKSWTRKPSRPYRRGCVAGGGQKERKRERDGTSGETATPTALLPAHRGRIIARSPGMRKLVSMLDRLRMTELPVLIRGETGTGKELIARAIHEESPRGRGPFRVIDCATILPGLLESELFGARRGAFTGLDEDRRGILELAGGGTVLVDSIDGALLEVQAKLLRVISSGSMRPVGAEDETAIDVRFLFSTSRDLEKEVRQGAFREDLLHRIRVVVLDVPPLRDRPDDIEELARMLLAKGGPGSPSLLQDALQALRESDWPGNVRELENVLARARLENPEAIGRDAVERARFDPRTAMLFPGNILAARGLRELKDRLERDYIVYHFRRLGNDTNALREFLGLSRRNLYRRCAKLGIRLRSISRR